MPDALKALSRRVQRWLLGMRPSQFLRLRAALYALGVCSVVGLVSWGVTVATYRMVRAGLSAPLASPIIVQNDDGTWSRYVNLLPAPVVALLANDGSTSGTISGMAPFFLNASVSVSDPGDGKWKQMWHSWDFGDGGVHVGSTVGHDYPEGTHNPGVTSRNAAGNETTASRQVDVSADSRTPVHVNYDAAPGGDGSASTPFDSLDDVAEADAIDVIIAAGTTATGTLTGTLAFTASHNNVRIRSGTPNTKVDIDVRASLAMSFAGDDCRIEDVRFMSGITSLSFNGAVRMDDGANLLALRCDCDQTMFQHSHSAFFVDAATATGGQGLSLVETTSTCPAGVTSRNGNNGYTIQYACQSQFYCRGCTFTEGNSRVMRIVCDHMGIYDSTWEQASTETSGVGNVITFEACNYVWSLNNRYVNAAQDGASSLLNLAHDVGTSTNLVFCRDFLDADGAASDRFGATTFGGNTALVQELLVVHCVFRECQMQRGNSSSAHDEIDVLFNTFVHTRQYNGVVSAFQTGIADGDRWAFGGNLHRNPHVTYEYSSSQGFSGAFDVSVPETAGGGAADLVAAWGDGTEQRFWDNTVQTPTSVPSGTGDAAMWYSWPSGKDVFNFGIAADWNDEPFANGNSRGSVSLDGTTFRPVTPGSAPTSNVNIPTWVRINFGFDHLGQARSPDGDWLRGAVDVYSITENANAPCTEFSDINTAAANYYPIHRITVNKTGGGFELQVVDAAGTIRADVTQEFVGSSSFVLTGGTAQEFAEWLLDNFDISEVVIYTGPDVNLGTGYAGENFLQLIYHQPAEGGTVPVEPGESLFVGSTETCVPAAGGESSSLMLLGVGRGS